MTTRKPSPPEALDDAALWQRFTAGATPLRRGRKDPDLPEPAHPQPAAEKAGVPAPAPRAGEDRGAGKVAPATPAPRPPAPKPLEIGHHPPGVDNTRWSGLTRGQLRPERSLDLHGMTLARAHAATRAFIEGAARDGCRVVEIVTGLGERGEGKIRREFLHWINAPDLRPRVLALAHPHRANPGAVRLLLRRPKRG